MNGLYWWTVRIWRRDSAPDAPPLAVYQVRADDRQDAAGLGFVEAVKEYGGQGSDYEADAQKLEG